MMRDQLFDVFLKMAETQHAVNCQLVGANDYYLPKYDRIVYQRAIAVEIGELYDHLGYKWWKKTEANFARARMEVIDLLHFELAKAIVEYAKSSVLMSECNEAVRASAIELVMLRVAIDFTTAALSFIDTPACEDQVVALRQVDAYEQVAAGYADPRRSDGNTSRIFALFAVAYSVGLTVNDMIAWYIGKASLNMFRNINGYTTGEYVKNWRFDQEAYAKVGIVAEGVDWEEDNDALEWTIERVGKVTSFDETKGRITATLQLLYDVQLQLGSTRE